MINLMLEDADKRCLKQSFWIINETTRAESNESLERVILEKTHNEHWILMKSTVTLKCIISFAVNLSDSYLEVFKFLGQGAI